MSGHTYILTYTYTYLHTYTQDNYSNLRCAHARRGLRTKKYCSAHARRGLMNKEVGMLLQKRANTSGVGISNIMRKSIYLVQQHPLTTLVYSNHTHLLLKTCQQSCATLIHSMKIYACQIQDILYITAYTDQRAKNGLDSLEIVRRF